MDTTFSFERYKMLLRHDLAENKPSYRVFLLVSLIASGVVMALCIIFSVLAYNSDLHSSDEWVRMSALDNIRMGFYISTFLIISISSVMSGVAQSTLCSCYNTRPKRLRYLMVPGTACEKFASRFTITSLLGGVLPFVVCIVFVVVHALVVSAYGVEGFETLYKIINDLLKEATLHGVILFFVTCIAYLAVNTATYMLASAFFRSYAYIKLFVVQYVLTIPLAILLPLLGVEWLDMIGAFIRKYPYGTLWSMDILGFILSVVMVWGSYRLFERTELTGYKLRKR